MLELTANVAPIVALMLQIVLAIFDKRRTLKRQASAVTAALATFATNKNQSRRVRFHDIGNMPRKQTPIGCPARRSMLINIGVLNAPGKPACGAGGYRSAGREPRL